MSVDVDLYAAADGAHAAVITNDLPALQQAIDPPITLGDETVTMRTARQGHCGVHACIVGRG